MNFHFIVSESTFLRYYMPLLIAAHKRGINSILYLIKNAKYNDPYTYLEQIKKLAEFYSAEVKDISEIRKDKEGFTFLVEGSAIELMPFENRKIVLTAMLDFGWGYDKYVSQVEHVIFPGRFIAEHYGKVSSCNIYIGSPKYDVILDRNIIRDKYKIRSDKNALIMFPRLRDLNKVDLLRIYDYLRSDGYNVIIKTRGKDPVPLELRGDMCFEDETWFPHTSMELIEVADIVVNTDSGSVKECVMLNTPLINFHIKPLTPGTKRMGCSRAGFEFLYEQPYCRELNPKVSSEVFKETVSCLTTENFTSVFEDVRKKYLFENVNVSDRILEELLL